MSRFALLRHLQANVGGFTRSTAPTINGDAVVGQTLYFVNGTYSLTPDSITPNATVGGSAVDMSGTDSLLLLDMFAGSIVGYSDIAHKSGYPDVSNPATSTGAVTSINLTNAITAFTRTSTSGDNSSATGLVFSVTFGSNVYEVYYLRAQVFTDGSLTTLTQEVTHLLTHTDLQAGATIDLLSDGLTKIGATQWLQLTVFTTSPNGIGYSFTYPTPISPTDAAIPMTWSNSDKSSNVTISGAGSLTATNSGGVGGVRSNRGIGSGKKVYWEYQPGLTHIIIGVADSSASLTTALGNATDSITASSDVGVWINFDSGQLENASTRTAIGLYNNTTDVPGLSLDTTGGTPVLSAYKNGTLLNSITLTGISSPVYLYSYGNGTQAGTLNPGLTPGGTDGVAHPQAGYVNP